MKDRECYSCDSNKTYVTKKGNEEWHFTGIENLWICNICYHHYITNPKWNPINNPIWNPRNMAFTPLKKIITLKEDPRIGVCNYCRAVRGIDCKRTCMHHDENRYDFDNPLKYAIEICQGCHAKETKHYIAQFNTSLIGKDTFNTKVMKDTTSFRKVQQSGKDHSVQINLPKSFARLENISRGDLLKCQIMGLKSGRNILIIERLETNGSTELGATT